MHFMIQSESCCCGILIILTLKVLYHLLGSSRATFLKGQPVCYLVCDTIPVYPPNVHQIENALKEDTNRRSRPEAYGCKMNITVQIFFSSVPFINKILPQLVYLQNKLRLKKLP